jgi:hypothetical protein
VDVNGFVATITSAVSGLDDVNFFGVRMALSRSNY